MSWIRTDEDVQDAWLWPEGNGVRWWTPSRTEFLRLEANRLCNGPSNVSELRDRRQRLSLRYGLAEPLGDRIADMLRSGHRLCLHLSTSLDAISQRCPFEWMSFDGRHLFGSLLIERFSPIEFVPLPPIHPRRPIAILNLLPAEEPIQPTRLLPNGVAQIVDGYAAVNHFLNKIDVAELGALVVIAHGTESSAESPFRLPDGRSWALPTNRGLPPLVILMACGNDEGNLVWDANRLLEAGSQTVLAPLGRPCPDAAGRFLASLLPAWQSGTRVGDILLDLQKDSDSDRSARLMQLIGRADLRMSSEVQLEELDDKTLAATSLNDDADALHILIDRLTLRCFQSERPLDQAEKDLRQLLNINRPDERAEKRLYSQLHRHSNRCWPLSQAWVKALEARLAEAYDHRRIHMLEQTRRDLERDGIVPPAPVYHYWAKLSYRQGRYALSLQDTARGLSELEPETFCTRAAGLIGHLVGLLVDVNLPDPAAILQQQLEECLSNRSEEDAVWARHKLRDRAARIYLRQGDPQRATALYQIKRRESAHFGGNGYRELAWLLYISAWCNPNDALPLASEVRDILELADIQKHGFDPGNADTLYLLRAYAAWVWRAGSEEGCRFLIGFSDLLGERLFSGDPGPPGFIFAFMHLSQCGGRNLLGALPSWGEISTTLEAQRYFLELSAFNALFGQTKAVANLLKRVHSQRTTETPLVFPDWLGDGVLTDWASVTKEQAEKERAVLAGKEVVTPKLLVQSGLLPL